MAESDLWNAPTTFGVKPEGGDYFSSVERAADAFRPFAGDIAAFRSPAEDWARLQTGMRPFWQDRAPMQDLATRMMGRYYLGAPYISTEARPSPTFADYLSQYASPQPVFSYGYTPTDRPGMASLEELRSRAREAAQAGTFVGGPGAYVAASQDPTQFARRSVYASLFGQDAENQAANQLAVAQMLAMQREGGGTYRGRMANAIRNAMQRVQQHRGSQGAPRESFLQWYLDQYHPESTKAASSVLPPQGEWSGAGQSDFQGYQS